MNQKVVTENFIIKQWGDKNFNKEFSGGYTRLIYLLPSQILGPYFYCFSMNYAGPNQIWMLSDLSIHF